MRVYISDKGHGLHYRADVSTQWARRHDNGALISCGLTVPDDLSRASLRALIVKGRASTCTHDEWNHSSCQSACVRRGDAVCRW